ncbi:HD-GYP domain-containing protein [Peribacillus sp. SCS-26]|uniref:HD-GYP domain-containing protein n=1 Tax=Paraperibacillus marinus TaxID=3115295 RepID=UPI003906C974
MNDQMKLRDYYKHHQNVLNRQLLLFTLICLTLSSAWNLVFLYFKLEFSRASFSFLAVCLILSLVLLLIRHTFPIGVMTHLVNGYILLLLDGLYFASGFTESWSYFLLIPVVAGLYGSPRILLIYSTLSLASLSAASTLFPHQKHIDPIDISNQMLCLVLIICLSYAVIMKLRSLYKKQLETVENAAKNTLEQVVKTFVVSVEAKDLYTFGHSDRVSRYAAELAKAVPGYENEENLKQMRLMGLLHDIGKINIPESILSKPSALTQEEYELIKTHTIVGAKMIEKIAGLEHLRNGVLFHHERWDGHGYPTGAGGLAIPVEARILAVADAFDAMTTSRAYRGAIPVEEAFQRLLKGKGTQFDPELIECLHDIKPTWLAIAEEQENPGEFEKIINFL